MGYRVGQSLIERYFAFVFVVNLPISSDITNPPPLYFVFIRTKTMNNYIYLIISDDKYYCGLLTAIMEAVAWLAVMLVMPAMTTYLFPPPLINRKICGL